MPETLKFFFREPTIDTNRPVLSRQVTIEGFEIEVVDKLKKADAWDCSFAKRMADFDRDDSISIPVFPNRKFRHSYIFVGGDSHIEAPSDLIGKRIGIKSWTNTAGVWCRGILQNYYGLTLGDMRWLVLDRDPPRFQPNGIRLDYLEVAQSDEEGTGLLDEMLISGELDAVIDPNVLPSITKKDGRTRRLFRNYYQEERKYFADTGIFPISHIVTLKKDFVARNPDAPRALLHAYREARDIAFDAVEGSDPQTIIMPWLSHHLDEQRVLMGERFFCYDIKRCAISLDAMMLYSHQQGLTEKLIDKRMLFHSSTQMDEDI